MSAKDEHFWVLVEQLDDSVSCEHLGAERSLLLEQEYDGLLDAQSWGRN